MTKIKSLLQKRQTSLYPGHEWLAIVVRWFHSYLYVPSRKNRIGNNVWAVTTSSCTFLLCQDSFPASSGNLFCNLEIEHATFTRIKHYHVTCQWEGTLIRESRWWDSLNRPCRVLFPTVDAVAKQRYVKQTKFCVQRESSPKAFYRSVEIPNLPITLWLVDGMHNRVLCCKSISINCDMHGWFLCW